MFNRLFWNRSKSASGVTKPSPESTVNKFMVVSVGHSLDARQCSELASLILKEFDDFRISVNSEGPSGQVSVNEAYEGNWVGGRVFSRVSEIVSQYVLSIKNRRIIFQVPTPAIGKLLEDKEFWMCGVKVEAALPLGPDSLGVPYKLEG